jgi:hypothetical protein
LGQVLKNLSSGASMASIGSGRVPPTHSLKNQTGE